MERLLGLLFLGAGLVFFASQYAPSPADREEQVAAMTRIVARAKILEPETVAAEQPGLRTPVGSPAAYSSTPAPSSPAASATAVARLDADASASPAAAPLPSAVLPQVTVTAPAAPPPAAALPPDSPNGAEIRRRLAREIQTELKRVGCYSGRINGAWGERSQAAMATFIARVNASLPIDEPDVFLLSLVKGQPGTVCGAACGTGEVRASGRCVTRDVVAELSPSAAAAAPGAAARSADARDEPQGEPQIEPLPGRMSIGAPRAGASTAPAAPLTDWPSPAAERLPWQTEPSLDAAPVPPPALAALSPATAGTDEAVDDAAPQPRKVTRARRSWNEPRPRPVKKRRYGTRSVQTLFLHPLGRM